MGSGNGVCSQHTAQLWDDAEPRFLVSLGMCLLQKDSPPLEIFSLIVIPLSSFSLTFEFRKPLSTTEKESKIFVVINFHPCWQLSVSPIFVAFSGSNGLKWTLFLIPLTPLCFGEPGCRSSLSG